jgi:Family of unknown function (DUF5995)
MAHRRSFDQKLEIHRGLSEPMFPYDPVIAASVRTAPQTIPDVLQAMQTIDATCIDEDGLKWFNWLYLAVTQAVEKRVNTVGQFSDPKWLSQLDVQFAEFYFGAIRSALAGASYPGCWQAMLAVRNNQRIARIQFALAGINAHINHDLCEAVVATCKTANTVPQHGTAQYNDYTALNSTFDSLINQAKQTLNVRLPGDPLPAVSHLEDLIAAWDVSAAREKAWQNAEGLWNLPPLVASGLLDSIDGFSTVIGKALLVPVP